MKQLSSKTSILSGFLILVLFGINACTSVKPLSIDVLKPAGVTIPPGINSVKVVNQSNIVNNGRLSVQMNVLTKEEMPPDIDSTVSSQLVAGFYNYMSYSPRFEMKPPLYRPVYSNKTALEKLNPLMVQFICDTAKCDGLVTIDYFRLTDSIDAYLTDQGYYAYFDLYNKSLWRFYSGRTGEMVDEYFLYDTIFWDNTSYDQYSVFDKFPPPVDAARQSAFSAGTQYAARVAPEWITVNRFYYDISLKEIKRTRQLIADNHWDQTIGIWETLLNGQNQKLASKAAFNIAIAYEVMDSLEKALSWAEKSNDLYYRHATLNYIELLQKRITDKAKLEKQLSAED
jgi:hypothetical protein